MGKVWAHPVIANGRLYLRDYEKLFVFDYLRAEVAVSVSPRRGIQGFR